MNEKQWLSCSSPEPMIRFLLGTDEPRVIDIEAFPHCRTSDRKFRLFACACFSHIRHLFTNELASTAVEVAGRYAHGNATPDELREIATRVGQVLNDLEPTWRASRGAERADLQLIYEPLALALQICRPEAPKAAYYASSNAYLAAADIANPDVGTSDSGFAASQQAVERLQADTLRDLIGPALFRPLPPLDPQWLTWSGGTVLHLARSIYEGRDFDALPILGDALEASGCSDKELLGHLHSGRRHWLGCWGLDTVLSLSADAVTRID